MPKLSLVSEQNISLTTSTNSRDIGRARQRKIMEYLHTWEYSTTKLLAKLMELSHTQVYRNVKNLTKGGFIHEEKYLKINTNYLLMLTDVGLAKLLGYTQVEIDNEEDERNKSRLQKSLEHNQYMEMTATRIDKTNTSLIKHNLYLQYFYHEIKDILLNQNVQILKMQNERQIIALTRFDRKNIAKQAHLKLIVARKNNASNNEISKLEEISRELGNDYKTMRGKYSDILISAMTEQSEILEIAIELEMTLKKDRELDHMFFEYTKKLESNNKHERLDYVYICSPMSLNPYQRYLEKNEMFAVWKYNGKSNRYEIVNEFTIKKETRQKFIFLKVNVDDSII